MCNFLKMKRLERGGGVHRKAAPYRYKSFYALMFSFFAFPFPVQGVDAPFPLSQPLTVRWQYDTERTVNLTPAANSDLVYLPLTAGTLLSLRAADGQLLWREDMGGEFSAAPLADEGAVYIASETGASSGAHFPRATGAIRALSHKSGITLWMRTLQSPIRGALTASRDRLFGGAADGRIYAIGKERGEILWMTQLRTPFASQPVVSGDRLYIGGEDGALFALEQATGRVIWRYQTRGALRGLVAVAEGTIYFGSADTYIYALREGDGALRWRTRTGAEVQSVAYTPRGLVVASLDNFVYFLSIRRGARLWKRQLAGRIASQPLTSTDSALFAPLSGDACIVLDLKDGKQINNLPVGEGNNMAASPVTSGEMLLVTTRQGLVAFAAPVADSKKTAFKPSP